jgi:hypothetical protein
MVVGLSASGRATDGWHQSRTLVSSPMVWGWCLRTRLGRRRGTGDGMGQSRWPPWCGRTKSIIEVWYFSTYFKRKQSGHCSTRHNLVLIAKDGILRKSESKLGKEPWTITTVHTDEEHDPWTGKHNKLKPSITKLLLLSPIVRLLIIIIIHASKWHPKFWAAIFFPPRVFFC